MELIDYITALEEALGMETKKNMMPIRPGDAWTPAQSTQALCDLVGLSRKASVKDGVKKLVDWYKDYYQI